VYLRGNVMGEQRKLLHNFYSSLGHVACTGQGIKVYKVLLGEPERKRSLGRPGHRREDGIRMDLRETGGGCELDLTSSGEGPMASYHYISMDIYRYISID
jgi:hypothetical protein